MQASKMPKDLKAYVTSNYVDSKSDLFAVFIERLAKFVGSDGLYAMITQHQWMFLSSFERLRNKINKQSIINMAHLGTKAFEEIGGEVVQTTAFVMQNTQMSDYVGAFVRLVDYDSQKKKQAAYLNAVNSTESKDVYRTNQSNFKNLPGFVIAYWASQTVINSFKQFKPLDNYFDAKTGLQTGDNTTFLRFWFEPAFTSTNIAVPAATWHKINTGGDSVRWYGQYDTVIYWPNNGLTVKSHKSSVIRNEQYYGKPGISWKRIGSSSMGFKSLPENFIFDQSGDSMFRNEENSLISDYWMLGYLNSIVAKTMLSFIAPTLNLTAGNLNKLPIADANNSQPSVNYLVEEAVNIAKENWDSVEMSWDFSKHPLVQHIDEHNRNWNIIPILNHCNVPNLSQKIFLEVNYG